MVLPAMVAGARNLSRQAMGVLSSEKAEEQELVLENWMVNDCYWKCIKNNCLARDYDEPLCLEDWMTNERVWECAALACPEQEKPLQTECWMSCDYFWKKPELRQGVAEAPVSENRTSPEGTK